MRHKPNMEIYDDVEQNDAAYVIVMPSAEKRVECYQRGAQWPS